MQLRVNPAERQGPMLLPIGVFRVSSGFTPHKRMYAARKKTGSLLLDFQFLNDLIGRSCYDCNSGCINCYGEVRTLWSVALLLFCLGNADIPDPSLFHVIQIAFSFLSLLFFSPLFLLSILSRSYYYGLWAAFVLSIVWKQSCIQSKALKIESLDCQQSAVQYSDSSSI